MKRTLALFAGLALLAGILAACVSQPPDPNTQSGSAPIRAAFYYGWFGGLHGPGWNQQGMDPFTRYHPSNGYYDVRDVSVVQQQIRAMQYGNISAGIASWWGPGSFTDQTLPTLLQAAQGTTFRWAPYYENEGIANPTVSAIESDLNYLKAHYTSNAAYLYQDGKPVVFVFNANDTDCGVVDRWHQAATATGFYVVLKVFQGYRTCANQPNGWHQYGPSNGYDQQDKFSAVVSPGFWLANESSPRLSRDPVRFQTDVQRMVASGAKWQLVSTFNEWGEGTAVESATEWATASGYGAYLDVLHGIPVTPGGTTTTTSPPSTTTTQPPTTTTTKPPTTTTTKPPTTTTTQPPPPPPTGPCVGAAPRKINHVVELWMENKTYNEVIGSSSAPYTTQLARQCATFTNMSEIGPYVSYPEYLAGTAGTNFGITSDTTTTKDADNIFRQARNAGLTAREYHEGTTGCAQVGSDNAKKHEPRFTFSVGQDAASNCTEMPAFSALDPNNLPSFSFITPNLTDDMHDGSVSQGDTWLKTHLAALINGQSYKNGDTLIMLTWDEDTHMPNVFISPTVQPGTVSTLGVTHYSELRLTEELFGLPFIGNASSAADMRSALRL